ncbi:hypothetical protein TWF694_001854 [Orbilia ellipsospora]|uniref:Uncharacterized protein n=1 Tax=Orbilia ellipsospora TaxID=2528407 RepID=A0AAV9X580_9PEZI
MTSAENWAREKEEASSGSGSKERFVTSEERKVESEESVLGCTFFAVAAKDIGGNAMFKYKKTRTGQICGSVHDLSYLACPQIRFASSQPVTVQGLLYPAGNEPNTAPRNAERCKEQKRQQGKKVMTFRRT